MTDSNEEKKVLGDLQPYSHYKLAVSVFNYKGEGPPSESISFSTPEGGKHTRQKSRNKWRKGKGSNAIICVF